MEDINCYQNSAFVAQSSFQVLFLQIFRLEALLLVFGWVGRADYEYKSDHWPQHGSEKNCIQPLNESTLVQHRPAPSPYSP